MSEEIEVSGIKGKRLKDVIYEWRRQYFRTHPRTKSYREKEADRVKRIMEMLRVAREGI